MCSFVGVFLMHGICLVVVCELDGLGLGLGDWVCQSSRYDFVLNFNLQTFGLGGSVFFICVVVIVSLWVGLLWFGVWDGLMGWGLVWEVGFVKVLGTILF